MLDYDDSAIPNGPLLLTPEEKLFLSDVEDFHYNPFCGEFFTTCNGQKNAMRPSFDSIGDLHKKNNILVRLLLEPSPEENEMYNTSLTITLGKIKQKIKAIEAKKDSDRDGQGKLNELLEKLRFIKEEVEEKLRSEGLDPKNPDNDNHPVTLPRIAYPKGIGLLGAYSRHLGMDRPIITIYMKNIDTHAQSSGINREWILATVFVHEMMHAFFDKNHTIDKPYIPQVEEPITEYAMLQFVDDYVSHDANLNNWLTEALRHVKSKQWSDAISYYGFGAYLYEVEHRQNNPLHYGWENQFRNVCHLLTAANVSYIQAFEWCYPFDSEEKVMTKLDNILLYEDTLFRANIILNRKNIILEQFIVSPNADNKTALYSICNALDALNKEGEIVFKNLKAWACVRKVFENKDLYMNNGEFEQKLFVKDIMALSNLSLPNFKNINQASNITQGYNNNYLNSNDSKAIMDVVNQLLKNL